MNGSKIPEEIDSKKLNKKKKFQHSSQKELDQEQIERWENEGGAIHYEKKSKFHEFPD